MWSWENSKAENQSAIEPSSTFLTPTHKSRCSTPKISWSQAPKMHAQELIASAPER